MKFMMQQLLTRFLKLPIHFCIDGVVNGVASLIGSTSGIIRKIQTGVAQSYAVIMMVGIAIALFWIILSL